MTWGRPGTSEWKVTKTKSKGFQTWTVCGNKSNLKTTGKNIQPTPGLLGLSEIIHKVGTSTKLPQILLTLHFDKFESIWRSFQRCRILVEMQLEAFKDFLLALYKIYFPLNIWIPWQCSFFLSTWGTHNGALLSTPCHFLVDGCHQDYLPGEADRLISGEWLCQMCM